MFYQFHIYNNNINIYLCVIIEQSSTNLSHLEIWKSDSRWNKAGHIMLWKIVCSYRHWHIFHVRFFLMRYLKMYFKVMQRITCFNLIVMFRRNCFACLLFVYFIVFFIQLYPLEINWFYYLRYIGSSDIME